MITNTSRNPFRLLVGLLPVAGVLALAAGAEPQAPLQPFQLVGVVQPAGPAFATVGVAGTVVKLRADVGDVVQAGDVLAELDSTRYKLELDRAQARLELAQARVSEVKAGVREADLRQSPMKERIAAAEAEVRLAKAELQLAEHDLGATQLRAPISGTVLARHAELGQVVAPPSGDQASELSFELADLTALEVTANAPESFVGRLLPGERCRIKAAAGSQLMFGGEVARVQPVIDPRTGSFPVRVQITRTENGGPLRRGMSVRVVFGDTQ
jgi:RND family efflux transporter MFP subunit